MIAKWIGKLRVLFCVAMIGCCGNAWAAFHLWQITEVYSNAGGTVQFIELTALSGGQQFLAGHTLTSSQGGSLTFENNLPGDSAGRKFLIGTTSYKNLNLVPPDYEVADGFMSTSSGTLIFANGADVLNYTSLPTDGVSSLSISLGSRVVSISSNSPTNFAGQSGSISPPATTPPGAPTNVIVSMAGISQLGVAYTPPANNGGANITSYTAQCGAQSASGLANPLLVAGLPKGVPVSCTVTATNSAGTGPASNPSAAVAPLGVPDAPTIGNAVAGDGQVTINFQAQGNTGSHAQADPCGQIALKKSHTCP